MMYRMSDKLKEVCIITESGRRTLGLFIRDFRQSPKEGYPDGWSLREMSSQIKQLTGFTITESTLSAIERGNNNPQWNTLAVLAATGFLKKPLGDPYNTADLFRICCDQLNPVTGENLKSDNGCLTGTR